MEKRQVKINFTLVGKCHKTKQNALLWDGPTAHASMLEQIHGHFGNREVYLPVKVRNASNGITYPHFYAAGWFVSDYAIDGISKTGSDLVVVAHGDTMEDARQNMMRAVANTPWDEVASNI